jgi:hypothetical protein
VRGRGKNEDLNKKNFKATFSKSNNYIGVVCGQVWI